MNLLSDISQPLLEQQTVELYLKHDIRLVEAAAYDCEAIERAFHS